MFIAGLILTDTRGTEINFGRNTLHYYPNLFLYLNQKLDLLHSHWNIFHVIDLLSIAGMEGLLVQHDTINYYND